MTDNVSASQLFSRASDFNINGGTFNAYGSPPTIQSVLPPTQNASVPSMSHHTQKDSENLSEIEVYVRLLLRRKRGYPLWNPKPGDWLPLAYRQEGVRIGDVGILTEFGGFDYLFNVCLPEDHPVNAGRVPQQFRQLHGIDISNTTWSTEEYKPGSYVASNPSHFSQTKIPHNGTLVSGVPEEFGAGLSFNSSATKGALLIVPEGGKRVDHQQYTKFSRYAAECARSWYAHVNGPSMARGVHNGALYLVTGCDKARAWGMASFIDAHPSSVSLEFAPKKAPLGGGPPDYVFTKCNYASSSSDADSVFGNQSGCMFLRGFKIAVRFPQFLPKISSQITYISDLDVENLLPRTLRAPLPMLTGKRFWASRIGSTCNSTHEQADVDDSEIDFDFPARYQIYHPSDAINRWILNNYTEVEVVITHDDDWTSVILEDEEQIPDDEELIRRVSNSLEMGNCASYFYAHFQKRIGALNEPTTDDESTSWRGTVSADVLNRISEDEIRRQEIIHELILKEREYLADLVSLKKLIGPLLEWLEKHSNVTGASSSSPDPASSVADFQPKRSSSALPILSFTPTIKCLLPLLSFLITSHTHLVETLRVRACESQYGLIERIGDVYFEKASGEWKAGWGHAWVQDWGFVGIDSSRTDKTGYDEWVAILSTCGLGVFSDAEDEIWGNEDWKKIVAEQESRRQNASEGQDDRSHLPNINLKRFTELLSLPAMHLRSYPALLSTILAESSPESSMYPSTPPSTSDFHNPDKRVGKEKEGNSDSSYVRAAIRAMRALWGYGKVKTFQLSMNVGAYGINGGQPVVNWEWFDLVSEEEREEIGKTESKRQAIIFEFIKGEMRYVQDLENVQQMYIIPLLNSSTTSMPIIPPAQVNQFISSVFSNINILHSHHLGLLQSLFRIQYDEHPTVHSISAPILDAALNWREAYMEYIPNYPIAAYLLDSQMRSNPAFKDFVQNCMEHADAHHLDMKNFINLPILRLSNYELLLKGILDEIPIEDADQKVIPQILDVIHHLGKDTEPGVVNAKRKVELWHYNEGLVFKQGEWIDMDLLDSSRSLTHSGKLLRQTDGLEWGEWTELYVLLFDNYLVLTKPNEGEDGTTYHVNCRPIPLDLLTIDSLTEPPVQRSTSHGLEGDEALKNDVLGSPESSTPVDSPSDISASSRLIYPITLYHLGRTTPQSTYIFPAAATPSSTGSFRSQPKPPPNIILYADSAAARAEWGAKLHDALGKRQVVQESNKVFEAEVLSGDTFLTPAGADSGASSGPLSGWGQDGTITGKVTCSVPFNTADGIGLVAVGCAEGVWVGFRHDPNSMRRVLHLKLVTQCAMLEDYGIFLVLADKSLFAYHMEALVPSSPDTPASSQVPQKLNGNKDVHFFTVGTLHSRTLVIYMKKRGLDSIFRVLEPVSEKINERARAPSDLASKIFVRNARSEWFKIYRDFFLPSESYDITFLKQNIVILCSKGFEIMNLNDFRSVTIPQREDTRLAYLAKRCESCRPIGMFKSGEDEFLLCYNEFGVYVDKHGDPNRPSVTIEWEGTIDRVALHAPYILLFNPHFIEIRHLETGRLAQIIPGNDIRCTWDGRGISTPSAQTMTFRDELLSQDFQVHAIMNTPANIIGGPRTSVVAQQLFQLLPTVSWPIFLESSQEIAESFFGRYSGETTVVGSDSASAVLDRTHDLPLFPLSIETKPQKRSTQTQAESLPPEPIVYDELAGPELTLRSKISRSVISPPSRLTLHDS